MRERRSGVWQLRVCVEGQQVPRTFKGGKRAAKRALADFESELGRAPKGTTSDLTVGQVFEAWWDQSADDLSPTTAKEYRRLLDKRLIPQFGATRVRSLRVADLTTYYRELSSAGLSPRTVRNLHGVLRKALNFAVSQEWLDRNPALAAALPKLKPKDPRPPEPFEVLRLIATADTYDPVLSMVLRLAAATGCRRGELCALWWTDIDFELGTLTVSKSIAHVGRQLIDKGTKTHATRRISLGDATLEALRSFRTAQESRSVPAGTLGPYVFSRDPEGLIPYRPGTLTADFGKLCKKAGIEGVRFHDLRHFSVTQLLTAGADIVTVMARHGHKDRSTTLNTYAHWVPGADKAAAEALDRLLG